MVKNTILSNKVGGPLWPPSFDAPKLGIILTIIATIMTSMIILTSKLFIVIYCFEQCDDLCDGQLVGRGFKPWPNHTQGEHQEFSNGGLTFPTRGLKYGFQGTITARSLQKKSHFTFDGIKHAPTVGYCPLALPWCHPWAYQRF